MYACPGREWIMDSTKLSYENLKELTECVDKVRVSLWAFFKGHKIDNL